MIAYTKDNGKTWNDNASIRDIYDDLCAVECKNGTKFKFKVLTEKCLAIDIENSTTATTIYSFTDENMNVVLNIEWAIMTISSGNIRTTLML